MPQPPVKGTAQVNAELPTALLDELKQFALSRGEKVREVIAQALRRHMDNPPPPPTALPPLPPVVAPSQIVEATKPAAKKPSAKKGGRNEQR